MEQSGARAALPAYGVAQAKDRAGKAARAPARSFSMADPKRRRAVEIVRAKRLGEGPPEVPEAADSFPGPFSGWHTRGYIPHCDKPGLLQMVSYRLHDAMPATRRREWLAFSQIDDERERMIAFETYLDKGYGSCFLKDRRIAHLVEENWLRFDGQRYRLIAWVIMPNHVHLLVEVWTIPLSQLLHSWKSYTAQAANRLLNRNGAFWQDEFWDRYIRDETHFNKAVRYIESNPVKAALIASADEWPFSSANHKWKWTGDGAAWRYRGAHVIHENWKHDGARAALPAWCVSRVESLAGKAARAPLPNP